MPILQFANDTRFYTPKNLPVWNAYPYFGLGISDKAVFAGHPWLNVSVLPGSEPDRYFAEAVQKATVKAISGFSLATQRQLRKAGVEVVVVKQGKDIPENTLLAWAKLDPEFKRLNRIEQESEIRTMYESLKYSPGYLNGKVIMPEEIPVYGLYLKEFPFETRMEKLIRHELCHAIEQLGQFASDRTVLSAVGKDFKRFFKYDSANPSGNVLRKLQALAQREDEEGRLLFYYWGALWELKHPKEIVTEVLAALQGGGSFPKPKKLLTDIFPDTKRALCRKLPTLGQRNRAGTG